MSSSRPRPAAARKPPRKAKTAAERKSHGKTAPVPKPAGVIRPAACRLFRDLTPEEFDRICECLNIRELHLKPKEAFIRETDPCTCIGVVVMGAVQLTRQRIDGGRNVLETVGPNETFGVTYAFREAPTMGIGVNAVGETTVLLLEIARVTRPCHKVCEAHLKFLRALLAVLSQKTFSIKQKLRILSQRTIRARLMLFLNIMAKRAKSSEFDIPYDRQALADFLCVDRSALSAEISKLAAERKLKSVKGHFKLLLG